MNSDRNNTSQAFWIGIGSLSTFAISIISVAILSRILDKREYGTYRQIMYVYSTLSIVFSVGLPRVFAYYLPRFDLQEGKHIVSKITKLLWLAGLAFSILLFLSSGILAAVLKNPELERGLKVISPVPFLLLPTLGIEGIFATYKRTIIIAIYNSVSRLIMLACVIIPVVYINGTYIYALYGWILSATLNFLFASWLKSLPFKGIVNRKASLSNKEILKYSLPLVTASIWGIAIKSADQFYISRYFGVETFAEFSNGFIELPFVQMITFATSTVLMPQFSKLLQKKSNFVFAADLWRSALFKSAILIYPIVVFFIVNSESLIVILYSKNYINSAIYFQIALLLNLFNVIFFAPLLLSLGKTRSYSRVHMILAIVKWTCAYFVILIFNSPVSVAVFSIIIDIAKIFVLMVFTARLMNMDLRELFPVNRLLLLLAHSIISIVIAKLVMSIFISMSNSLIEIGLVFLVYIIILLSSSKLFKIDYLSIIIPVVNRFLKKRTSTLGG